MRSPLKGWEDKGPLLSMREGMWPPDVDTADRVFFRKYPSIRGSSLPMQVPYADQRATGSQPQSCPACRGNWGPTILRSGDTLISVAAICLGSCRGTHEAVTSRSFPTYCSHDEQAQSESKEGYSRWKMELKGEQETGSKLDPSLARRSAIEESYGWDPSLLSHLA